MKKGIFAKLGAVACVLTLVTTSLVGGTFAKYTTTLTGEGVATAAKWSIVMKQNDADVAQNKSFNLVDIKQNGAVKEGTIAPGASGEIKLTVDGTQSDVGYTYKFEINNAELNGIPVKFYSDQNMTDVNELKFTDNVATLDAVNVPYTEIGTAKDKIIYWQWASDTDGKIDTSFGTAATTGKITVTMTAEQYIPVTQ